MTYKQTIMLIALLNLSIREWDLIPESVQDKLFEFFQTHKVFPKTKKMNPSINTLTPDRTRFCNVTGRIRWRNVVLEQECYANFDSQGMPLEYPKCAWFPVPTVEEPPK